MNLSATGLVNTLISPPLGSSEAPDLSRFINPRSVALIGATEGTKRFGGKCLGRLIDFGFKGDIYPVNPKFEELRGRKCYPSIRDLPEVPDHVGVVVPADHVLGILKECADFGVPFATVYTGGFAEGGTEQGRAAQASIRDLARATGMRVMGPNCNGLINFRDHFAMTTTATIEGPRRPAGDVAVVSQSGGVGQVNVMWRAQANGIGITYEISCGNSADLDVIDFLNFMIADEATKVIMMVVEHIASGERLAEAARKAAEVEKPIVMLKLGRTEAGGRAAASHTGAMMASDTVVEAALKQYGIIRVTDTNDLYDQAMLLRTRRWPRGNRIGTTSASGGNAALLVDLGAMVDLTWPEYGAQTREEMSKVLPKLGSSANPTDVTNVAIGQAEIYKACMEAIAKDDNIDALIPIFTMSASGDLRQAAAVAKTLNKPAAILWTGGCTDDPTLTLEKLASDGTPVFRDTLTCARAMRTMVDYANFLEKHRMKQTPERPAGIDQEAARGMLAGASGNLTERASRQVLQAYGLPPMQEGLATSAAEAVEMARNFGTKVALKIESADISHKTEAGGIRLGLFDPSEVGRAFEEIMASAHRYNPKAALNGVLVQEMAAAGLEMVVGLTMDPTFGPVVVAGAGGIHVEVMRDLAYRIAPVGREEARAMLRELRAATLLDGARGAEAADIEALCDVIVRLSWLGHDFRNEIAEVDINPVRVYPAGQGVRIVDALVVAGAVKAEGH